MRYWVYINDKVTGPYEESKILALEGFTPDTLICSEIIEEGASQEWVPASSVLHIPDAVTDNVSERQLDPGISTNTYVAAKELDAKEAKPKPQPAPAAAQPVPQTTGSAREDLLLEKISKLGQEIESLRGEIKNLAQKYAASPAAKVEDPLETILAAGGAAEAGRIITHEDAVDEESLKSKVSSIAENNTPPQMDVVGTAEAAAPQFKPDTEEIFKEDKIVDSFPASSVLPELNETLNAAPQPVKENFAEPVLPQVPLEEIVGADNMSLTQTLTGPLNTATEEEAAVVSSAMDSIYRTPRPAEKAQESDVEFEDLIHPDVPGKAAKLEPAAGRTTTIPEIQLGSEKTSLISDFLPPTGNEKQPEQKIDSSVQEIIAPGAAEEVNIGGDALYKPPVVKRVKPADIKTNPLISASRAAAAGKDTTEKINILDQSGAQEETTAAPKTSAMRKIMVAVMSVVLLVIIALGLMFSGIVPDVFGLFTAKKPAPTASQPAEQQPLPPPPAPALPPAPAVNGAAPDQGTMVPPVQSQLTLPASSAPQQDDSQVLSDAQNYVIPAGLTLKNAVAAKHPAQAAQIEWSIKQYDAANYIVSAKVPPATPSSLMVMYRFNYVPATRELKPLTSDSKNLLGVQ